MPRDLEQVNPQSNLSRDDERALVAAAKDGDNRAFGRLVETYQRRVYSLAFGILRNREDAWDVAQEAFVKAFKNLARFEGQSAFYTWLYRITYNLSMDHLRSRSRRETVGMEPQQLEQRVNDEDKPSFDHPSQSVDRRELREVLHSAMMTLTEKHRAIIVLREIEGLSYEEMADVLKISKGTVMSRLFHARKNLQKALAPYLEEGEEGTLSLATQGV